MKKYLMRFLRDEDGADTIEYVLIIAVSLVVVGFVISKVIPKLEDQVKKSAELIGNTTSEMDGSFQGITGGGTSVPGD